MAANSFSLLDYKAVHQSSNQMTTELLLMIFKKRDEVLVIGKQIPVYGESERKPSTVEECCNARKA